MGKANPALVLIVVWVLGDGLGGVAHACSSHGSVAASLGWLPTGQSGGVVQGLLTLETFLVPPTVPTTCTAGVGLGSLGNPLPAGVDVAGMAIVVVDSAGGSRTPVPAFSFLPNAVTTSSLAAGSGSSSVPNTNPLFDGSVWFGFSSAVLPFPPPSLGPGEFTAFQFTVEIAEALLPLAVDAQFAGGEGEPDSSPIFDGAHPAQYFTAADPTVVLTAPPGPAPAPALSPAALALALGVLTAVGLSALAHRRGLPLEERLDSVRPDR